MREKTKLSSRRRKNFLHFSVATKTQKEECIGFEGKNQTEKVFKCIYLVKFLFWKCLNKVFFQIGSVPCLCFVTRFSVVVFLFFTSHLK